MLVDAEELAVLVAPILNRYEPIRGVS